ncbi:MAG TPA: DNA polymerase III subunit epsilon [Methylophaga aminisulfidivorans]|uniref:DNA polymerase III subunit epsilon n=1 Tax=Methylophaga TaxID=40222 RepID=UPI0017794C8F|nr:MULTISPECIES: DNA polymerase III subunit epsilon [Methylophaga]HIC48220.1 DNA polymerase III subunit epsilon [Methylophaga sp.]HIM41174.1 DNA polymerase III subunit epsilon [Methylophaga aminisulfidivorans]
MAENVVKRQVILDTETTGISTAEDHRIIEIGCVEMVNRRLTGQTFHQYINPHREIDAGAIEVHGITNEFLADKPSFEDIAEDFLQFIEGAELIIHNAPFDVGFIDHELKKLSGEKRRVNSLCTVLDTLKMARDKHPGQKNNLDALCKRYDVDNSNRELHGALLDAEILADVYLAMTGGQVSMLLAANEEETATSTTSGSEAEEVIATVKSRKLKVIRASEEELAAHEAMLEKVQKSSGGECVWLRES